MDQVSTRRPQRLVSKSDWQMLYVIGTNLTLIRANVINMPNMNPN
jgi:hypothetical protein